MRLNSSSPIQFKWVAMVLASGISIMSIPGISIGQTVYVEPLHIGHEKGRLHDEYADVLRGILRENGLIIVPPLWSRTGAELPPKLPNNAYVVFALVLKQSTLHPRFLCAGPTSDDSSHGYLTISGKLRKPTGEEVIFEDATTDVTLYRSDVICREQGMTEDGKKRIFREAMSPIAEQVVGLIRK